MGGIPNDSGRCAEGENAERAQCRIQLSHIGLLAIRGSEIRLLLYFHIYYATMHCNFYHAKPNGARYCQGKLFVRLSVTLRYRDHIAWNSAKIISRLISLTFSLSADPSMHDGSTPKGTPPNFSRNRSGVGKIVDFRHLSRRISETVQDRVKVAIDH